MTTQQPESLRLAEQYDYGDPAAHSNTWKVAVCTELRRLHVENETLRAGYAAARLEIESLKAQLHAAKQINAAQFGLLAASIPGSALRASHGQAPAGDWLWVKLMDFCKKRGFAPANFNDLFEIVDAARAARTPVDSVPALDAAVDAARKQGASHDR